MPRESKVYWKRYSALSTSSPLSNTPSRRVLYVLGISFVAGQIVSWYALGMPGMNIAVVDKPVQVVLILVLVYLDSIEGRVQHRARR